MQYIVRNRRRLRPATGELLPATQRAMTPRTRMATGTIPPPVTPMPTITVPPTALLADADTVVADVEPLPRAEGSGLHRRPLVTEINLTVPVRGRGH